VIGVIELRAEIITWLHGVEPTRALRARAQ
jgi:hypothetical protein